MSLTTVSIFAQTIFHFLAVSIFAQTIFHTAQHNFLQFPFSHTLFFIHLITISCSFHFFHTLFFIQLNPISQNIKTCLLNIVWGLEPNTVLNVKFRETTLCTVLSMFQDQQNIYVIHKIDVLASVVLL